MNLRALQLGLFGLHACLALYVLTLRVAFPDKGEQQLYEFPNTWDLTEDPPQWCAAGTCPRGVVPVGTVEKRTGFDSTLLLLFAEVCTALNHLLSWLALSPDSGRWLRALYYDDDGKLHGVKVLFFLEYAASAACMTVTIFSVYAGYVDYKLPAIMGTGIGVSMVIGAWIDAGRWMYYRAASHDLVSVEAPPVSGWLRVLALCSATLVFALVSSIWVPSLVGVFANGAPAFVKGIVLGEFVLFSSFGVAHVGFHGYTWLLRGSLLSQGRLQGVYKAEIVVLSVLSLVAKGFLLLLLSSNVYF